MEGKNESKHTPKWRWILNESSKTVRLESTESGRDTIMDFVRYGMSFAQPRFNVEGIMIKAEELGETVEGREHHAEWFKFINHPTAKLIESIPALLEVAKELIDVIKEIESKWISVDHYSGSETNDRAYAAIIKANKIINGK